MYQRTEEDIMASWKGNLDIPVVSICCTTYNHEPYIAEAINGFLMQETDFPFEILIRDDFSTDKTALILKEYADKYRNLIKPIFEKENQFSKGVKPMRFVMKKAIGKYIALCEGDDYWTDPLKLQKQVDFLNKNHEFSYCFHDYETWNEDLQKTRNNASMYHSYHPIYPVLEPERILLGPFMASTLTLVFRNNISFPDCFNSLPFGDKSLEKLLAFYGKGFFMNESMACYREHQGGISKSTVWKESMSNTLDIQLKLFQCLKKSFPYKHDTIVNAKINYLLTTQNRLSNPSIRSIIDEIKAIIIYSRQKERFFFDKCMLLLAQLIKAYFPNKLVSMFFRLYNLTYKMIGK